MFLAHASRTEVLDEIGLTGAGVADRVNRALATRAEAATRD
jgi:deoxyxylulose-5-phosphate synthase